VERKIEKVFECLIESILSSETAKAPFGDLVIGLAIIYMAMVLGRTIERLGDIIDRFSNMVATKRFTY